MPSADIFLACARFLLSNSIAALLFFRAIATPFIQPTKHVLAKRERVWWLVLSEGSVWVHLGRFLVLPRLPYGVMHTLDG